MWNNLIYHFSELLIKSTPFRSKEQCLRKMLYSLRKTNGIYFGRFYQSLTINTQVYGQTENETEAAEMSNMTNMTVATGPEEHFHLCRRREKKLSTYSQQKLKTLTKIN